MGAAPCGGGGPARARALLMQRMTENLSVPMRDRLDELVAVRDDHPHSPLHGIKTGTSSPSVGGMKRLLARNQSSRPACCRHLTETGSGGSGALVPFDGCGAPRFLGLPFSPFLTTVENKPSRSGRGAP